MCSPPSSAGSMSQLHRHRMAVDAAQHFGQPVRWASLSSARRTDVRDHFAAARHRELGQLAHRLVGALAAQQLDRLAQQCRGVRCSPLPSSTLRSNPTRPSGGVRVVAQQVVSRGWASRMRANRNSWSSTSSTSLALGAYQQCLPRDVFDGVDQVGLGRPALRHSGPQHLEGRRRRPCRRAAARAAGPWARGRRGTVRCRVSDGLAVQQLGHRSQIIGQASTAWSSRSSATSSNRRPAASACRLAERILAVTASSRTASDGAIASSSSRNRSTVADCCRRVGDVVAHQFACPVRQIRGRGSAAAGGPAGRSS